MRRAAGLAGLLTALLAFTACGATIGGPGSTDHAISDGHLPVVAASALPAQAQTVLEEIEDGGPFEYPGKDGSTFGNYEHLLPKEPYGYYKEYTVDTLGASTRGARRIIAGRDGELYYTGDHYESFERIRP